MHYKIFDLKGSLIDESDGTVKVAAGALVVAPNVGQPFTIQPRSIEELIEPDLFTISIQLSDGSKVELSRLGQMRTQLLADLSAMRHQDAKETRLLVGIGNAEKFKGVVNGSESEVFLYDDALVAMPNSGETLQLLYSFVESVESDATGYHLKLLVKGDDPVSLERFANRTGELLKALQAKVAGASVRTSAFLSTLLPGLGPIELRTVSDLLRDGIAGEVVALNSIDSTIFPVLLEAATTPPLKDLANSLVNYGDVRIGFKQRRSVERKASGGETWYDHTHKAIEDHGGTPSAPLGFGGVLMGSMVEGGLRDRRGSGFAGAFESGGFPLACEMLGMSMWGQGLVGRGSMRMLPGTNQNSHNMAGRNVPSQSPLKIAHTDYESLRVDGDRPTILAFLLVSAESTAIYAPLNDPRNPIVIFDTSCSDVNAINRALALVDFEVGVFVEDVQSVGSRVRTVLDKLSGLNQLRSALKAAIPTDDTTGALGEILRGGKVTGGNSTDD